MFRIGIDSYQFIAGKGRHLNLLPSAHVRWQFRRSIAAAPGFLHSDSVPHAVDARDDRPVLYTFKKPGVIRADKSGMPCNIKHGLRHIDSPDLPVCTVPRTVIRNPVRVQSDCHSRISEQ